MVLSTFVNAYLGEDGRLVKVGRDEDGRRVVERGRAEWVSYMRVADVPPATQRGLERSSFVSSVRTEGKWLRIGWRDRFSRHSMMSTEPVTMTGGGARVSPLACFASFEGDVDPVTRWLIDSGAKLGKPRRVYLDIETDSRCSFVRACKGEARVLSWAIVDDQGRRRCDVLDEDSDEDEARLLRALWAALDPYDQVVAWYGDGFDFPVIWARSAKLKIQLDARQWLYLDQKVLFARMNSGGSGEEKQSMKLEDIAQAKLGEGKTTEGGVVPGKALGAQTWEMWEVGGEIRARMVRYNMRDADLLRKLEAKTGFIAVFDALCEACSILGNTNGLQPTRQLDGFILRLGRDRGEHYPTKKFIDGSVSEQYEGAFVMRPKKRGIVTDVHVVDFAGQYPSVILTFNMGHETKRFLPPSAPLPAGWARLPKSPAVCFDTTVESTLVVAVRELLRLRKHWTQLAASLPPGTPEWVDAMAKSTAYKVAVNAFYGVVGSKFSRFYDEEIAEGIAQTAKWLIEHTIEQAELRAMLAVYADTDSCYVQNATREVMRAFVEEMTKKYFPNLVRAQGCTVTDAIKLEYEKAFKRIVFTGAKKRYVAAFDHYKGSEATADSAPEIKGVEYKRGDASLLAREMQGEVIDLLVGGLKIAKVPVPSDDVADYHDALGRWRARVLEEPLGREHVVLSKGLNKPLRAYVTKVKKDGTAAAQPPHVTVAHILKERGQDVEEGTRVEYVVVDGAETPAKVIPADDYDGTQCDRYYVWENTVYPATRRLLEAAFPDQDWKRWGDVRPPKPRRLRSGVRPLEGQLALALDLLVAAPQLGGIKGP